MRIHSRSVIRDGVPLPYDWQWLGQDAEAMMERATSAVLAFRRRVVDKTDHASNVKLTCEYLGSVMPDTFRVSDDAAAIPVSNVRDWSNWVPRYCKRAAACRNKDSACFRWKAYFRHETMELGGDH